MRKALLAVGATFALAAGGGFAGVLFTSHSSPATVVHFVPSGIVVDTTTTTVAPDPTTTSVPDVTTTTVAPDPTTTSVPDVTTTTSVPDVTTTTVAPGPTTTTTVPPPATTTTTVELTVENADNVDDGNQQARDRCRAQGNPNWLRCTNSDPTGS